MARRALLCLLMTACSPTAERADLANAVPDDPASDAGVSISADRVEIVQGVPDRGRDPAVVAIDVAGEGICSGALVSPRLVLTARHCVSKTTATVECPATGVQIRSEYRASDLGILVGEDIASARRVANGLQVLTPSGVTLCDADIALIVLDEPVVIAKPLPIRARGPALGDRIRAVGFGRPRDGDPAGKKLLREHVRVSGVTSAEFTVGEATCSGDSGGPALDQDTGEIIGVVSRGGPACEGPDVHNIYTRLDTYAWLVEESFARVAEIDAEDKAPDGGTPEVKPAKRGTKSKPPTDLGGPCETGADCAAGVCIIDDARRYCSRPCGPGDRCPTRYHCKPVDDASACINVR